MYEKGLDDASRTLANKLCILRPFTGTTEVISCLMGHNVGHDDLEKIYFLKRHEIGKSYYYDFSLPGLKDFAKLNVESNSVWYTDLVSQYLKCVERFQAFFDQEVFDSTVSELSFRSKNWGNVGTIFQRAQKSMKYYPTIALELNEKAKIGAEDLKDNSLIAFALAQKGEIFLNIGKVEDAKQSFIESQISAQKIVDPSDKARALFEISKEFRDIKMFEDANRILVESLDLAQKMENPFSKIGALTKIGDAFRDLNDFKNATRAFDESLKSAQEIQNPIFRADVLSGISRSFHEIGKPEKAIQAINMSSASVQRIEDPSFKLDAMEKLCDRYQMIGENDKFIECAEQAKEITKMIDSESAYDAICLIKGVHPLRLEEGGIRFDMLARTEMGKDGNIYAIKDQVGIPLDRKINLGKPMTEAEAKKRTTIFRADGLPMCGTVGVRKYDEAVVALHHMWEFRNKWGYRIR
jgi:tetratricopeptide (TPR) repeat protein